MPTVKDFRGYAWDPSRVSASGRYLGRQVYWKLYSIENSARVLLHSVLTVQVGSDWWAVCVDPNIRGRIKTFQADYAGRPWHGTPGRHEIYYAHLTHLATILRTNSHLFTPFIPDVDEWILRIEQIRLPRNITGHMNWLGAIDKQRIDVFHSDFEALMAELVANRGLVPLIP